MQLWKKALILSVTISVYTLFSLYVWSNKSTLDFTANDYWGMIAFLILMCLMVIFPMQIKGINIVYLQPVSLAIFLLFGLIVEVILLQLAILFLLLRVRASYWERYCMNGSMFLITSIGSAMVYYILGGTHQFATNNAVPDIPLVPIMGYVLASILINHFIIHFIQTKIRNVAKPLFGKEFWWEFIPLLLISPTGVLLYILYLQLNILAVVYVMIPIVTLSIIFRLYNRLDIVRDKLNAIHDSGNDMFKRLEVDHVVNECIHSIKKLVPYQYGYIFNVDHESQLLQPIRLFGERIADDERNDFMNTPLPIGVGVSGQVAQTGQTINLGTKGDYNPCHSEPDFLATQNSILAVPLMRNEMVIGVMTLTNTARNSYTQEDATLVEILANQAAIALRNAMAYEDTKRKSEIDELTGLYNYRHFEHVLFAEVRRACEENSEVSLILLDIDYFKSFNDTYGHFAGNHILRSLAHTILEEIRNAGLVCRYGGEEFTILLPKVPKQKAFQYAEALRKRIEQTCFPVIRDLAEGEARGKEEAVYITVSLGVATFPDHAEDALSLVRHADRAMYVGAKRKGRNKVAMYEVG